MQWVKCFAEQNDFLYDFIANVMCDFSIKYLCITYDPYVSCSTTCYNNSHHVMFDCFSSTFFDF